MNDGGDPVTLRLRITGKVQGVWYRGWTVETARGLGLAGWVRNRADGSVEALAHGPDARVRELAARCRRGPPAARVDDVRIESAEAGGDDVAGGFTQRPTV